MTVTKTIYNHFLVSLAMRISTYIIKITTENVPGSLLDLANVFKAHSLSIKKVQSHDSIMGNHQIVMFWVNSTKKYLDQILAELNKHRFTKYISVQNEEKTYRKEVVLFKLNSAIVLGNPELGEIMKRYRLEFWGVRRDFIILSSVIEDGRTLDKIYKALVPYGILECARSGKAFLDKELNNGSSPLLSIPG